MKTRTITREEALSRLSLPIDPSSFDHGICHLYAHALIDRAVGAGTTSLREEDLVAIDRYFQLLAQGLDRGAAIRQIEAEEGREVPAPQEPRSGSARPGAAIAAIPATAPAVLPQVSPTPAPRSRDNATDLRFALEDEVDRAVARARDRLKLDLHEACHTIAADAERLSAKQGIELRARVETATREALEVIDHARKNAGERVWKAALADVQTQIKSSIADAATEIAGIRRFEADEAVFEIRESGEALAKKAAETLEKKIKESENYFRAFCEVEVRTRAEVAAEGMRADFRTRIDASLAEASRLLSELGRTAGESANRTVDEVAARAAKSAEDSIVRRAAVIESDLREVARDVTSSAARAAEQIQPAFQAVAESTLREAVDRIGTMSKDVEDQVRKLAESEVRARIDTTIEQSLAIARARIEDKYLESAHQSIQKDLLESEQRLSERIEKEIVRFETRIHTCFELAREVNNPVPPRNRVESFHAFLSGLTDLLWPLWSIIAGPGRVYANRTQQTNATQNVVTFPASSEIEKAA